MIKVLPAERFFSLSCFEGLRLIRKYNKTYPSLELSRLVELVLEVESDAVNLDMEAATYLHESLVTDWSLEGELFYQGCIKAIVILHRPIWARSMRQGRMRFIDSLEINPINKEDDLDVFRATGLLREPPSEEVVAWWDDIVGQARLTIDNQKMAQARRAESLTIKHERQRLHGLGIYRTPEWKGLDDNFAGYDVLSFDLRGNTLRNIMIEVKSTVASPLRFHLSRNEWNTAAKIGDAYRFYIWDMAVIPPRLFVRTVEELLPHIPSDNRKGRWSNTVIPLGS